MAWTHTKYHVVFSTKERRLWIAPDKLPRFCQYMAGIVKNLHGHPILFNGTEDHVHLVLAIPPTRAVSDFVRDLKSNTTSWVHETFPELKTFCWQDSYFLGGISPSVVPSVIRYVENQQEHHKTISSRDEMIWLLKNHGIEFDDKYV